MKKEVLFFVIVGFLSLTNAVLSDHEIDWDDSPYVVKIFARRRMNKTEDPPPVKSCTGALISPSLILTNVECVRNFTSREELEEIMVAYHQYGSLKQTRVLAETVEKTDDWALLQINPIDVELLCPSEDDRKKRITRLNIKPSLTKEMKIELSFDAVKNLRCWMTGFATTGKNDDFIKKSDLYKLELTGFEPYSKNINGLLYTVTNDSTACLEDLGTALICRHGDSDFQVGFLRTLQAYPSVLQTAMEHPDPQLRNIAICQATAKMIFVGIYDDQKLIESIEKYDLGGFVNAYSTCKFNL